MYYKGSEVHLLEDYINLHQHASPRRLGVTSSTYIGMYAGDQRCLDNRMAPYEQRAYVTDGHVNMRSLQPCGM